MIETGTALTGTQSILLLIALVIFITWSLCWKGIALWTAAKNGSKKWFIFMLIVNTAGILEILYIFYFSKKKLTSDS